MKLFISGDQVVGTFSGTASLRRLGVYNQRGFHGQRRAQQGCRTPRKRCHGNIVPPPNITARATTPSAKEHASSAEQHSQQTTNQHSEQAHSKSQQQKQQNAKGPFHPWPFSFRIGDRLEI